MNQTVVSALLALTLVAGAGRRTVVKGTGRDEFQKLRAGPTLGFKVILGRPDDAALTRHDCVTEVGQLWCRVSLANAPAITGYVSADYFSMP